MGKLLLVYNTCGIKRDNTEWYIECLNSFLEQEFDDFKVVLSSCMNSRECITTLANTFRDKISYCYYSEPHTVNITFNKTVQEMMKKFGEFEYYVYIDSGCIFNDDKHILQKAYDSLRKNDYGMLSLQVDTDEALQTLSPDFKYQSDEIQITGEDFLIPLGKACNAHVIFHSHELYEKFDHKLWPDVFKAYCTESTFTFLNSVIEKRWAILKDLQITHRKSVDGASVSVPHISSKHGTPWNNLFYQRDANEFINDPEAKKCGLGYEECNNIMMHDELAYDQNGYPLFKKELEANIKKYFFLTKEELDYNKIKCRVFG